MKKQDEYYEERVNGKACAQGAFGIALSKYSDYYIDYQFELGVGDLRYDFLVKLGNRE